MTSQQNIPSELGIDEETGEIRLSMSQNRIEDYNFDILIRPLDGNNVDQTLVSDVQISIACCSDSTTLTSEPVEQINQAVNLDPHLLQTTGSFYSSNYLCPIWFVKLDDSSKEYFELNVINTQDYRIKLRPEYALSQGTYDYTIMFKADGGAQLTTQGNMIVGPSSVNYDCDDAIAQSVPSSVNYDIPKSNETKLETIVDFGPYSDCFSSIQVEMQQGQQPPSYYQVDQQAGVVHLNNSGDELINDRIRLKLTPRNRRSLLGRSLQAQNEITNYINVVTQCGPESTQIDSPELYKLILPNDAPTMMASFNSTNSQCPIVNYDLEARGGEDETEILASEYFDFSIIDSWNEADRFRVTLKEYYTQRVNDYFFYVTATAIGGATDTAAAYMSVLTLEQIGQQVFLEVQTETETETNVEYIQPVLETDSETEVEYIQPVWQMESETVIEQPLIGGDPSSRGPQEEEKDSKAVVIIILLVLLALMIIACLIYHTNCCQYSQTDDASQSEIQASSGQKSLFETSKRPTQLSKEQQVADSFGTEAHEGVTDRPNQMPRNQEANRPSMRLPIDQEQNLVIPQATPVSNFLDDTQESALRMHQSQSPQILSAIKFTLRGQRNVNCKIDCKGEDDSCFCHR